jgi:hypothetical protein
MLSGGHGGASPRSNAALGCGMVRFAEMPLNMLGRALLDQDIALAPVS